MTPDTFPNCHANLQGDEIPEDAREHYGGKTHYRRTIAIYNAQEDRTVAWRCPDCGHEWERK